MLIVEAIGKIRRFFYMSEEHQTDIQRTSDLQKHRQGRDSKWHNSTKDIQF